MGAVEEAQIRDAARVAPDDRVPVETLGILRALARTLGMVADDLTGVIEELEAHEADAALAQHALGVVTGVVGTLDGLAPEREHGLVGHRGGLPFTPSPGGVETPERIDGP